MTAGARASQKDKDRIALAVAVVCAVAGVLIWTLWVLPISRSIGDAAVQEVGGTTMVELNEGESAGIWGSGQSFVFGTVECTVLDQGGELVSQHGAPPLNWDDTLWWMNPRVGFAQHSRFTAPQSGAYDVRCGDSLDTYGGEFLIAGDSFGSGAVGLGRTGSNDFAVGTVLAFCAVVCPLVAVLLIVIVPLRVLRDRRRSRRLSRSSFEAA